MNTNLRRCDSVLGEGGRRSSQIESRGETDESPPAAAPWQSMQLRLVDAEKNPIVSRNWSTGILSAVGYPCRRFPLVVASAAAPERILPQ